MIGDNTKNWFGHADAQSGLDIHTETSNLVAGINPINHGIETAGGGEVSDVIIYDQDGFKVDAKVDIKIIDGNNAEIILAGGNIPNAKIDFQYKVL